MVTNYYYPAGAVRKEGGKPRNTNCRKIGRVYTRMQKRAAETILNVSVISIYS